VADNKRKKSEGIEYNISKGIAYQRGIDLTSRCYNDGLPIILTDGNLADLKVAADFIEERGLTQNLRFGVSGELIGKYIEKLIEIYSDPATILNGLRAIEKIRGSLDGSDLFDNPFAEQMEKIKYRRKNGGQ
jgi:hypothetical protein